MTKTKESNATPTFEFFEGNLSVSSSRAQITVRRGGLMVLSKAAVDLLTGDAAAGDVSHVQLAYDAETGAVGVRACDAETPGRYTLRSQKTSPARLVGGKRFFKHHGLAIIAAETYTAERFKDGIVGFYLPKSESSEPKAAEPVIKKPAARRKTKTAA